ncbi:DNA-3-methyladenine glycosylase family protein [Taibaiella chishuiensis]|uniref:DNA-3-methyladenine glycosylase II n=1 Tax=Taibaiella chishuiensis TaxID=1434707 RepID=A0A2P8D1Z1_9BACT|nr:DNA-3-methyladenine glycosylase [Taibaiella chishuiensis]PSK91232.1 DNA-3-methyladenine glycosylase II [Taibaiella chishuiensis]
MKKAYPAPTPATFNEDNYQQLCDHMAGGDPDLKRILDTYGYPPMWTRPNTFETLVHIILEQQVSLASALATLNKLKEKLQDITPDNILRLNDEAMRACFVSRQKAGYLRGLAEALNDNTIKLDAFAGMPDDAVRQVLVSLKGIGNWTVDVYLMFALQRVNIFPVGDLAAVNAVKRLKQLPAGISREEILAVSEAWKPFRSIACMLLWHYYLSHPRKKTLPAAG